MSIHGTCDVCGFDETINYTCICCQHNEIESLKARLAALEESLSNLVSRLQYVHNDGIYQSVWLFSQLHHGPYKGPTYTKELDAAIEALSPPQQKEPVK